MTCCGSPTLSGTVARKVIVFALCVIRLSILIALIAKDLFDATFYTYASFFGITVLQTVGLVALFVPGVARFYYRFVFPVLFQSAALVSLLITIIVALNDQIYIRDTIFGVGTLTIAMIHTGDWVLHQWPLIEMFITLCAIQSDSRVCVRRFWLSLGPCARVAYTLYLLWGVMLPVGLYAMVEDWNAKYPTPMNHVLGWFLILGVAALIGGLFIVFQLATDDIASCGGCVHSTPCAVCACAGATKVQTLGAAMDRAATPAMREKARATRELAFREHVETLDLHAARLRAGV